MQIVVSNYTKYKFSKSKIFICTIIILKTYSLYDVFRRIFHCISDVFTYAFFPFYRREIIVMTYFDGAKRQTRLWPTFYCYFYTNLFCLNLLNIFNGIVKLFTFPIYISILSLKSIVLIQNVFKLQCHEPYQNAQ